MASTMQLEFTQAMSDFKTMFPEMDDDVIEAVLRANMGAVDATIDQLLAMSTDNQNEKLRNEIEKDETGRPILKSPISQTDPVDKSSAPKESKSEQIPLRVQHSWKPPLLGPLPANFLRCPTGLADSSDNTDLEDEKIALFLQNEEFMAELRWNQDFLCALDKEQGHNTNKKGQDEEADFKERLKNMGKLSRKKFSQLTKVFTWQGSKRNATATGLLQEEASDDEDRPSQSHTSSAQK
ncbi:CUE domain-containing protein 1 [Arctopsyche grandis]|uniref:CUE domain-containing protein 1 n=1 Tax=Arctopsyche grandis TaxID=121162 RepID=UPI00406D6D2B